MIAMAKKSLNKDVYFFKTAFLYLLMFILCFLTGCDRKPSYNFQAFTVSFLPNHFLVCPKNYCRAKPMAYSPAYPISAEDLFNAFNQMAARDPSIHFVYTMPESGQFELTVQSRWVPLPSDVSIQFMAISSHQSTVAIYSQSRYGVYDFGLNKRRVENWLATLSALAAASPLPSKATQGA